MNISKDFSWAYDTIVNGENVDMKHIGAKRLNKITWKGSKTRVDGKLLGVFVDANLPLDETIQAINTVAAFFKTINRKFVFNTNQLYIMYHPLHKNHSGQASGLEYNNGNDHSTIIFINKKSCLVEEDVLLHELVHAFDYMTKTSDNKPWGSSKRTQMLDPRKRDDELLMDIVKGCIEDIQVYCNDPAEELVVDFFCCLDDNPLKAMSKAHGLDERVIQSINEAFLDKHLTKKRARNMMRQYIRYQKDKPTYKYLNQMAARTKAGRL